MLKIRLQRVGRKHETAFRVVLTDSKNSTKSGKFNEILGSYNPKVDNVELKADRIKYWIENGAKPTDTVHNILISQKVIEGKKVNVLPKKSPIAKEKEGDSEEAPKETDKPADTEKEEDTEKVAEETKEENAEDTPKEEEKAKETKE